MYVIIPTENSYINFNNKKTSSLQICDIAQNYRIINKIVLRLSQYKLKISKHCHIEKLSQRK
jgi:hypothetical protein